MALWKKFWLLFAVIWVTVSLLNAATIVLFSPDEAQKAWRPAALAVAVPALAYLVAWAWVRWKARKAR